MVNFKKIGISLIAAPLTFGILAPSYSASQLENIHPQKIEIEVASTETVVSKNELIKRFKELFPNEFDFLSSSDFHMSGGHTYPEDDRIRYDLSFHKRIDGKDVHGGIGFIGENFEIERFYFDPANAADALYPAKITKADAEKIAIEFLNEFVNSKEYQLDTNSISYPVNQTITEPIRYQFSFVRTKNEVPIPDQRVEVTVLGNGDVVNFYRNIIPGKSNTFDDVQQVKVKDTILEKVKENLSLQLQYQVDYDYRTDKRDVHLVYKSTGQFSGVHALSGDWQTSKGFSSELPKEENTINLIIDKPLQPKQDGMSLDEAKKLAEDLLAIDSEEITLTIESIEEMENPNGQEVISVNYMYQYHSGGHGTNIVFDKNTGEIIQYHDIKRDVLRQIGEKPDSEKAISREDGLTKAIEYLKEFAPSKLHNYSLPIEEEFYDANLGFYHFTFPRVVNGIPVSGDHLSVTVASDGSLSSLNVNQQDITNWPSSSNTLSLEEAKEEFINELDLKLQYQRVGDIQDENHYYLVYTPEYKGESYNFLDANSGKWISQFSNDEGLGEIEHSWAKDELNYLLDAGVLELDNIEAFDADQTVTKGKAIEIIMKSLTYFYPGTLPRQEDMRQSFDNIDPKHPLYQAVERAVSMGILETRENHFDVNSSLTREELAVWYIRALDLEEAAKHNEIYQLNFADAENVNPEKKGYVALATSIGLLSANQNRFNPEKEVSYAELAVSTIRLAHHAHEKGIQMY